MKEIVNQTRLKSLNLNFVLTYSIPVYVFPKLGTYVYFKSIIKQIIIIILHSLIIFCDQ